jgi:hypothetical protein
VRELSDFLKSDSRSESMEEDEDIEVEFDEVGSKSLLSNS